MKPIAIVALLFGLVGAGMSGYAMVETKPNHDSLSDEQEKGTDFSELDQALLRDYSQTMGRLIVGAWACGLIAVICGAVAMKKGAKGLGAIALIIGLAGAILGVVIMPQPLVL